MSQRAEQIVLRFTELPVLERVEALKQISDFLRANQRDRLRLQAHLRERLALPHAPNHVLREAVCQR